jgi:hypothetical protein
MSTGISKIHPVIASQYSASTVANQEFPALNVTGSEQTFFAGYQPLFIKIAGTGIAGLDTQATPTSAIVEGTRSKALKAVAAFGTILGTDRANATTSLTVIVDAASFNTGNGLGGKDSSTNDFSGLKAAVASATGVSSGGITITAGYTITSAGVIEFA